MHRAGNQDGRERRARCQREIERVFHPRQRIVPEHDIANRSAAKCCDASEQAYADPVHAAPSRGKGRRHGLRRERRQRQHVQDTIARRQAPHRNLMPRIFGNLRRGFHSEQAEKWHPGDLYPEPVPLPAIDPG